MALFLPKSRKPSIRTGMAQARQPGDDTASTARPARPVVLLGGLAGEAEDAGRTVPRRSEAHEEATTARQPLVPKPRRPAPELAPAERSGLRPQVSASIAVACRVVELVDDTCSAVLLSQLIYWTRRGREVFERNGWVHKTAREWEVETGLSWKMQRRARRILTDLGLLEERLQSMPACLEFRLNLRAFVPLMAERSEIEMPPMEWSWITDRDDPILGRLLGRSFLFHKALVAHMSVPAAMMASRLLSAQSDGRGRLSKVKFVQLSRESWRRETGLTRHQWQTARRDLKALGLLIERRHNFPRRIDLSIDQDATAPLLLTSVAAQSAKSDLKPEAGSVWAKQEGRFGHHPKQPAASPKPTDSDRPNQPIAITQSGLYLYRPLQVQLHPQPQPCAQGSQVDWSTPQWGWGGLNSILGKAQATEAPSKPAAEHVSAQDGDLVWPAKFGVNEGDRDAAEKHLAGLDRAMQQTILDEIAWQASQRIVRSPVGLLRTLCRKAAAGEFAADGAHRIASARRKREQLQRDDAAAANASAPTAPSDEVRAKLGALRSTLKVRRWTA